MHMPSLALIQVLFKEVTTRERSPRRPEPALIMDDAAQVESYVAAGREGAVMAPVYLFHCSQICEIIRPGDTIVDLACGPANQLAMVARMNPATRFIGVDLSRTMLEQARQLIAEQGLDNVTLRQGDITDLSCFDNASIDGIVSTMALHHLPDTDALGRTFTEAARVLKPGGGIYMVDFGHLKAKRSIRYFAYQYADRQPEIFTTDYLNSLHAAFRLQDMRRAARPLLDRARLYSTFLVPYMVALKSPPRRVHDADLAATLRKLRGGLPRWHQDDFSDLSAFFRAGGLSSSLLR